MSDPIVQPVIVYVVGDPKEPYLASNDCRAVCATVDAALRWIVEHVRAFNVEHGWKPDEEVWELRRLDDRLAEQGWQGDFDADDHDLAVIDVRPRESSEFWIHEVEVYE